MTKLNQSLILEKSTELFAHGGLGEFRIRLLAEKLGISPSVIYHYFTDEHALLKGMFEYANTQLGKSRAALPRSRTSSEMLRQRIVFQIDNAEKIVAVLKYYFAFRSTFQKHERGFMPDKSARHMEEVLQFAKKRGEYSGRNVHDDALVMTHAINGFLLEYYPYKAEGKEKTELTNRIFRFLTHIFHGGTDV